MVPPSFLPNRSTTRTSPGCSMSMRVLVVEQASRPSPWPWRSRPHPGRPRRHELHGEGPAHHLLAGMQHMEAVFVLVAEAASAAAQPPPEIVTSSADMPRARSSQASGTFGRPSGKAVEPVQASVKSIICSLVRCTTGRVPAGARCAASGRHSRPRVPDIRSSSCSSVAPLCPQLHSRSLVRSVFHCGVGSK